MSSRWQNKWTHKICGRSRCDCTSTFLFSRVATEQQMPKAAVSQMKAAKFDPYPKVEWKGFDSMRT